MDSPKQTNCSGNTMANRWLADVYYLGWKSRTAIASTNHNEDGERNPPPTAKKPTMTTTTSTTGTWEIAQTAKIAALYQVRWTSENGTGPSGSTGETKARNQPHAHTPNGTAHAVNPFQLSPPSTTISCSQPPNMKTKHMLVSATNAQEAGDVTIYWTRKQEK